MEYRRLGRYGIRVSEVSLGGWLTHGRSLDQDATTRVVRRAFELGITTFDTADAYNRGEAERALAKAIDGLRREDLVLATKCYFPMSDNPNDRGLSRKHIFESVHASLRRLNTDYIDLFQFHRFDSESPLDETIRAIDDLVRQGKVLYWGVSEWQASQIAEAVGICRDLNANPPASNQPNYSMLHRWIEADVMPTCARLGLGLVVFSPLAQGILTGKYLPGHEPPAGSRGADPSSNMWMGMLKDQALLKRVQNLKAFAQEHGCTLAQFALAWILRRPEVSSVIVGATRPEQVEENAQASGLRFPAEVFQEAERILTGGE
ncbi:MAG: aldo/keto reductase family protein [Fimbriimonadales bacterium]|nr:aldo/keto reductase family protein [Fimbriimonadales bacterium]